MNLKGVEKTHQVFKHLCHRGAADNNIAPFNLIGNNQTC